MDFVRGFDGVGRLKADPLFGKLLSDMKNGGKASIFPAVRNQYMSFYYKGGGLFTYQKEFSTHFKYAFVPENIGAAYVTETSMRNLKAVSSFFEGYEAIKERCEKYGGIEAEGVSELYAYSAASHGDVILLDTEIALSEGKDRIDILLYDTLKRNLLFCEAKHFSNPGLWAAKKHKPKVAGQIGRYNAAIAANTELILGQYANCVEVLNQLLGCGYSKPLSLQKKTGLLIFGYDAFQSQKITDLLIAGGSLNGIPHYAIGNMGSVDIANLYKQLFG